MELVVRLISTAKKGRRSSGSLATTSKYSTTDAALSAVYAALYGTSVPKATEPQEAHHEVRSGFDRRCRHSGRRLRCRALPVCRCCRQELELLMIAVEFRRSDAFMETMPKGASDSWVAGSFEWALLTYDALRVAPEGDTLAVYDADVDAWIVTSDSSSSAWSDVVLSVVS